MLTPTFTWSPASHRGPPRACARTRASYAALMPAGSNEVPDRRSPLTSGSEQTKKDPGKGGVGGEGLLRKSRKGEIPAQIHLLYLHRLRPDFLIDLRFAPLPLQRARPNFRISRFLRFPHFPETGLAKSAFFQKIKAAEIMPFITPRPQARKKSGFATPSKQVPLGKWASNRGFAAGRSWDGTRAQASSGRVRQAAGAPAAGPGPEIEKR